MLCFIGSNSIEFSTLYNKVITAKPMADSVAAIVRIKRTKIWPTKSSRYIEKAAKFKLIDNSKSSIDMIITKIFLRFKITPSNPIKKTMLVIVNT